MRDSVVGKPVLTKHDFVNRYIDGEFGNASPSWHTMWEFLVDIPQDPTTKIHIRSRVAGGPGWYNVPLRKVLKVWYENALQLGRGGQWYISEMAPTHRTLLQGEVQVTHKGLELFSTTVRLPMRDALRMQSEHSCGIMAVQTLRRFLCPNSYEWMQVLLERYPGHVVEFSAYERNWGTLPNFNTVFWEVRMY